MLPFTYQLIRCSTKGYENDGFYFSPISVTQCVLYFSATYLILNSLLLFCPFPMVEHFVHELLSHAKKE
uniref:Uncharacterized protein n=1 Tax=Utricularia reniformis TaxID=192314 RepID=A0A1Y0B4R9_9LAMI|nr:hypothetical protein AEK19_MT2276 [Utricularia reniformis]ART32421.1 hypothetical protein AEK19_MT2276 [Utricularia reniformis]